MTIHVQVTLCDSLTLTVDRMDTRKKQMLLRHRETIVKDLDAKEVLDELYSSGVLTSEDIEKIRSQVRKPHIYPDDSHSYLHNSFI